MIAGIGYRYTTGTFMTDYQKLCKAIYENSELSIIAALITKVKSTHELNNLDLHGKSPLYLAVEKGNSQVIKLLVDNGANLDLIMNNNDIQEANNTPRKLANNTNPELLMLSKIKVLSDNAVTFKQVIDQQIPDMKQRSITPDTHKSRTMVKNQEELGSFNLSNIKPISLYIEDSSSQIEELKDQSEGNMIEQIDTSSSDCLYYVDEYQYKDTPTSHVLHFGINTSRKALKQEIQEHNDKVKKNLQEAKVASTISNTKSNQEEKIECLKQYKDESKLTITIVEKNLVQKAIDYLDNNMQKTALVEVFERDQSGKVKKGLGTHTVVLYKQAEDYLVIDPSNTEFSDILIGASDRIITCFDKKLQIYKPQEETGYQPKCFRDCIDIAIKLAFQFNKYDSLIELIQYGELKTISAMSLKNHIAVESITNQQEVSNFFPKILGAAPARAKQSSDIIESQKVSLYIKLLKQNNTVFEYKKENTIFTHQKNKLIKESSDYMDNSISKTDLNHASYLANLILGNNLLEQDIIKIDNFNSQSEVELIGEY